MHPHAEVFVCLFVCLLVCLSNPCLFLTLSIPLYLSLSLYFSTYLYLFIVYLAEAAGGIRARRQGINRRTFPRPSR